MRGYDAAKRVKGRKRHIITDTLGNVLEVVVHADDIQGRDGARLLLGKLGDGIRRSMELTWADGGYRGKLVRWMREEWRKPPSSPNSRFVVVLARDSRLGAA